MFTIYGDNTRETLSGDLSYGIRAKPPVARKKCSTIRDIEATLTRILYAPEGTQAPSGLLVEKLNDKRQGMGMKSNDKIRGYLQFYGAIRFIAFSK
jgi:hypothetical protein